MEMYNPCHPGEILDEYLEQAGISVRAFAENLHVAPSTITRVLKGQSALTAELAVKLAKAINPGPSVETWLGMQIDYDAWHAKHDVDVSYIHTYTEQDLKGKRA